MGIDFVIGCDKHEEAVHLLRGRESEPMHKFLGEHMRCEERGEVFLTHDQSTEFDRRTWAQEAIL